MTDTLLTTQLCSRNGQNGNEKFQYYSSVNMIKFEDIAILGITQI